MTTVEPNHYKETRNDNTTFDQIDLNEVTKNDNE